MTSNERTSLSPGGKVDIMRPQIAEGADILLYHNNGGQTLPANVLTRLNVPLDALHDIGEDLVRVVASSDGDGRMAIHKNLMDLCESVLALIDQTQRHLAGLQASLAIPKSTILRVKSHFPPHQHRKNKTKMINDRERMNSSIQTLHIIFRNVQDLHMTWIANDSNALQLVDGYDRIRGIEAALKNILDRLYVASDNTEANDILLALGPIANQFEPVADNHPTVELETDLTSAEIEIGSTSPSPLEVLVSQNGVKMHPPTHSILRPHCSLHDFIVYAEKGGGQDYYGIYTSVGQVCSVHLRRQTKTLLEHEYAIISFGHDGVPTSWIRVERAARIKDRFIQSDSLAPLLGGAPLRETVSFSASMHGLIYTPAEEWATISIGANASMSLRHISIISLYELARDLESIDDAHPLYRLWTANCRFFARRLILTLVDRAIAVRGDISIQWRQEPCSRQILVSRLQQDSFGGKEVDGPGNAYIHAVDLIHRAQVFQRYSRPTKADELLCHAKAIIENMLASDATVAQRGLAASGFFVLSLGYTQIGKLEDARIVLQECIRLFRILHEQQPNIESYQMSLAASLLNLSVMLGQIGTTSEAYNAAQEAVSFHRLLYAQHSDIYRQPLARSLNVLASRADKLGLLNDARNANWQANLHYHVLHLQQPDVYRQDLANSLYNLAGRYHKLGLIEDARDTAYEASELRRVLYTQQPDVHRESLADALHNLAAYLGGLSLSKEARDTFREAIALRRVLDMQQPCVHRSALADSLHGLAILLYKAGLIADARNAEQEAAKIRSALYTQQPDAFRQRLADSLYNLGVYFGRVGLSDSARQAAQEDVTLRRTLYLREPDIHREDLADSLRNLAVSLCESGLYKEAHDAFKENIALRRVLYAQQPEIHRKDFADSLHKFIPYLSKLKYFGEAHDSAQEAVSLRRILHTQQPEIHSKDLADSLHKSSLFYAITGNIAEARHTSSEAVELRRLLYKQQEDIHREDLADSLDNLAKYLRTLGLLKDAQDTIREAIDLRRILDAKQPVIHRAGLAHSLQTLASIRLLLRKSIPLNSDAVIPRLEAK